MLANTFVTVVAAADCCLWLFIRFQHLRARVVDQGEGDDCTPLTDVKVVDVDTVTQAKTKIIEAVYKDKPYSDFPRADDLEFG